MSVSSADHGSLPENGRLLPLGSGGELLPQVKRFKYLGVNEGGQKGFVLYLCGEEAAEPEGKAFSSPVDPHSKWMDIKWLLHVVIVHKHPIHTISNYLPLRFVSFLFFAVCFSLSCF